MTIPTVTEELDRKVLEEVERLEMMRVRKAINEDQYAAAMLAIWNIASGLVPRETMDILTMTGIETARIGAKEEVFMRADNRPFIVNITRKGPVVHEEVLYWAEGGHWNTKVISPKDFGPEIDGHESAAQIFEKRVKSALSKGFTVL
jgi:hypothetical protein